MVDTLETPTLALSKTDAPLRKSITRALEGCFTVKTLEDNLARSFGQLETVTLMIYDLKLGISELKKLRIKDPELPILVIAPKKGASVLDEALALGAADYVTQPLDTKELVRRCVHMGRKALYRVGQAKIEPTWGTEGESGSTLKKITVQLSELHGPSGRLNAAAIAKYLDVPLSDLALALRVNYTALHKTPDSYSVQQALAPLKQVLVILSQMLGPQTAVRVWLNSPHPDLGGRIPLSVMLEGHTDAVLTILENALAGIPA